MAGTENALCAIGLGAQKAGTTTVARELSRHPDFAFSQIKELHYFDALHLPDFRNYPRTFEVRLRKMLDGLGRHLPMRDRKLITLRALNLRVQLTRGQIDYVGRFDQEFANQTFACFGEISPAYGLLPVAGLEAIRDIHPRVKVFVIMRDPFDRLMSHLRFEVTRGAAEADSITTASVLDSEMFLERSRYDRLLKKLDTVFPAEDVHLCFFETLRDDPEAFYRALYAFLGIDYLEPEKDRQENRSERVEFTLDDAAIMKVLQPSYDHVFDRFADTVPEAWRRRYAGR